jgi:hypothetical protein
LFEVGQALCRGDDGQAGLTSTPDRTAKMTCCAAQRADLIDDQQRSWLARTIVRRQRGGKPSHGQHHPCRDLPARMRIAECVELEQDQTARDEHIIDAYRFGPGAQTATHCDTVQEVAQHTVEVTRAGFFDWLLMFEAIDPLSDASIAPAMRLDCPQQRLSLKETSQSGQIHRFPAQSDCPGRLQRPLVGAVAIRARVAFVVFVLEQLIGDDGRAWVEQIRRRPAVERPDQAAMRARTVRSSTGDALASMTTIGILFAAASLSNCDHWSCRTVARQ